MKKFAEQFELVKYTVVFAIQIAIDVHKFLKDEEHFQQRFKAATMISLS